MLNNNSSNVGTENKGLEKILLFTGVILIILCFSFFLFACGSTVQFPLVHNDGQLLRVSKHRTNVTFIGHSTVLVQLDGMNFLTDPMFSDCAVIIPRVTPPGVRFEDLPQIDFVIISHNHYDHLDLGTLERLDTSTVIIVPRGVSQLLLEEGIKNVRELDWWQSTQVGSLRITAVPCQHFSGRGLLDTDKTGWNSYVVEGGQTVYHAGDTGYFEGFKEIGEKFSIDIALIPIGAYKPRWFMKEKHVDPYEAVQAFKDLRAKWLVPIHWGTFRLSLEPMDEPPQLVQEIAQKESISAQVLLLKHGETNFFQP